MGGIEGPLIIGLSLLVLAWYFLGQQAMRRRGLMLRQWVRDGLPVLGDDPQLRWLGSSAFQAVVGRPAPPFRALSVTVVLEPREILFLWLVNRLRQRRDLLVVRGDLTARPRLTLELFRDVGRSGAEARATAMQARWPLELFDKSGLWLATPGPPRIDLLHTCLLPLQARFDALLRLSIRETSPHMLVNYTLRPQGEGEVRQLFHCLLDLAWAALAPRAIEPDGV